MKRILARLFLQGVRDLALNPWAQISTLAAVTLEEIEDLIAAHEDPLPELDSLLLPLESALEHWPAVRLTADAAFYLRQGQAVLVPQFGGDNQQSDALALKLLQRLLPERKVVGLPARIILLGGGNLHCISQQVPKGEKA